MGSCKTAGRYGRTRLPNALPPPHQFAILCRAVGWGPTDGRRGVGRPRGRFATSPAAAQSRQLGIGDRRRLPLQRLWRWWESVQQKAGRHLHIAPSCQTTNKPRCPTKTAHFMRGSFSTILLSVLVSINQTTYDAWDCLYPIILIRVRNMYEHHLQLTSLLEKTERQLSGLSITAILVPSVSRSNRGKLTSRPSYHSWLSPLP